MRNRTRLHETSATTPAKESQKATFLVTPDRTVYHNPTNYVTTNRQQIKWTKQYYFKKNMALFVM
ncbi:hypothetical protein ACWA1C_25030 [Flectobacillus roseus]